ncbi:SPOR domain-containing protein [Bacteroidota bacterium]
MNEEIIKEKLKEILKIGDVEKDIAFKTLMRKLITDLKYDEAMKIDSLGIFQLKREPIPREERKRSAHKTEPEKIKLIYSPFEKFPVEDKKSAFFTFDVDEYLSGSEEHLENILNLSINKPLIPISEQESVKVVGEESLKIEVDVETQVYELIEGGIIVRDFELWDEIVKRESKTESLQETEDDDLIESLVENYESGDTKLSDVTSDDVKELSEGFVDETGEQVTESIESSIQKLESEQVDPDTTLIMDDNLAEDDNAETKIDFAAGEKYTKEDDIQEEVDPQRTTKEILDTDLAPEKSTDEFVEISEAESENGDSTRFVSAEEETAELKKDTSENLVSDLKDEKRDLFKELEEYLKDEDGDDSKKIRETSKDEPEGEGIKIDEAEESDKKKIEELESKDQIKDLDKSYKRNYTQSTLNRKSLFILSIIALVILIIVVYVFWPKDSPDQGLGDGSQQPKEELIYDAEDVMRDEDAITPVTGSEQDDLNTEREGIFRKIENDTQVTNQIFYDGEYYTVQLSSWRSSVIAEREVTRLRDQGYDAFIYQVYLSAKGSTWNRVRVGYFNSVEEAENFINKLNSN